MSHDLPSDASPAGLIVLAKPPGRSSAQYAYRLRPIFGVRKIGHAGTLDPFADGVLLACVGRATRLIERLMALPKIYRTTLRLDVTNETFDPESPYQPLPSLVIPTLSRLQTALGALTGEILQAPPAYSAIKVQGRSSYQLARRGQAVPLSPRPVRVDRLDLLSFEWPRVTLEIACGRGTYIRAIARDLGVALGCGGCCESLSRTAIGPFTLDEAVDLTVASPPTVRERLLSVADVLDRLGG